MIWWIYNVLFGIGFVLMLPKFLLRMRKRGGYSRDFGQRLGRYRYEVFEKLTEQRRVWIHAVSVGELFVALKLMERWREARPEARFVVSVTTSTGYALAEKRLDPRDVVIYFPVDFPPVVSKVLGMIKPLALVMVEVEWWPNLIRQARGRGIPVALVNGRVSERSFRGYKRVGMFTRRLLPELNVLCVQSEGDGQKLVALGAEPEQVVVTGSAKYDIAAGDLGSKAGPDVRGLLDAAGITRDRKILLGGSTWPGEEEALLDVYKSLKTRHRDLALVLAPRHVERVPEILELLKRSAKPFVRRSEVKAGQGLKSGPADVFLLDTTGELASFYGEADVIFVGKSLTQHGGQNILEPAAFARPVVVGPNMENFQSITRDFLDAGALVQVPDLQNLRRAVDDLLYNDDKRRLLGEAAAQVIKQRQGALDRTLAAVLKECGV